MAVLRFSFGTMGSGKSTLASLIPRFFDVEEGSVTFDGIDVRERALDDLRARIGIVPQEPMLFGGTVRENLVYGNLEASQAEIEEVSRAAHAAEFIETFPDGYDQVVGERGVTLSAGQRQRIAIARVMLKDAPILVLDEATSALDSEVEAAIQETLYGMMEGKTVIAIAHRLSTIADSDRILVLENGRLAEQGRHAELLRRDGLYAEMWARQQADSDA